MARNDEELRKQQEYRELLKLRQGIIEESEMIPEDVPPEIPELHGWKKVENFFYHNKWLIIIVTFAVFIVGFMTIQAATRPKEDIYVLAISTQNASGIYYKTDDIERALEKYCPDFDGNGYVHVGLNVMDLSMENGYNELTEANRTKFITQILSGESQMFITDVGILDEIYEAANGEIQFFRDFTEEYPDAEFYEGVGLQLNTTGWIDEARWASCPDILGLYVRDEYTDMTGKSIGSEEQRRRALIIIDNIINGNIVNPD